MVFLGSCTEPETRGATTSTEIPTVVNSAAMVEGAPVLSLVEDLRIGVIEGMPEEVFEVLTDLAVNDSGEIFALDSRKRSVRVFGPGGRAIHEFGGPGQGPGEFQNELLRVALSGDTVLVQDRVRFHVFQSDGEFLGSTIQRITGNRAAAVLARTPESWVLGQAESSPPRSIQQRTTVDTFRVFPVDLGDGTAGMPLLEIPSIRRRYLPDMQRSQGQWFGANVEAAVRPNGQVYLVNGDDYEVDIFSPAGEPLRRVRADVDRVPLRDQDFRSALDDMGSFFGLEVLQELGHPEVKPISGRLLVGPSGGFLIKRLDLSSNPRAPQEQYREVWDLFGADGRIAGRLTTNRSIDLRVFSDEFLYAIARDDLDVQYVVRYRFDGRIG